MKLCVGLGNPGPDYSNTRHNVGFLVVDEVARRFGTQLTQRRFYGTWAEFQSPQGRVGLLKPETYMNRSGQAVQECLHYLRIGIEELVVVHDDLDLDLGAMKLAWARGAAGHRGVASVLESLASSEFWRLRVGIGRPPQGSDPVEYVLQAIPEQERAKLETMVGRGADTIVLIATEGPEVAQQRLHQRQEGV